eukprot:gene6637-6864_t
MADSVQLFPRKSSKRKKIASDADQFTRKDVHTHSLGEAALPERANNIASTSAPVVDASTFKHLGVSDWLCSVLKSLGIRSPTQVQVGCIPAVLSGKDVIGTAQTGSGKTAAFALPILQQLAKDPYGIYALVLTPTRELAMQLADQFRAFGAGMSLKDTVIIGGVDMRPQAQALARRPHIVVATPGRLAALIESDRSLADGFARVKFLVMDEADRLLDASFEADLRTLLAVLPTDNRQTLLFSATLTASLVKLQQASLEDAYVFQAYEGLKTADRLQEQYVFIPQKLGVPAAALHSGNSQKQRLAALNSFKSERVPLLLATDVASRGLDIPSVDLVVNYDLPVLAADYVHRVGRTARAGRAGWALSFITQYDVELVGAIESHIGHKLEEYEMDEAAVLKGITKVYNAKKAAALAAMQQEDRAALFDSASATYTYLLADPHSKQAVLIDPVLEQVERDLQIIDELGLELSTAANTHCHADHITGTGKLKALRPGVTSRISAAANTDADVKLQEGDTINVGSLSLQCLATPGHTDGCMSFYLAPLGPAGVGMVFTGDALLIRGCGRTDFQQGNAGLLYDNVHSKLFTLPEDTLVWPAHDYKGRTCSSIAEEKQHNLRLTKPRDEFIDIMANLGLPYPKQIDRAVPANLKCGVDFPYD